MKKLHFERLGSVVLGEDGAREYSCREYWLLVWKIFLNTFSFYVCVCACDCVLAVACSEIREIELCMKVDTSHWFQL